MNLSKEDSDMFYEIWIPLLDFANKRYKVMDAPNGIVPGQKLDTTECKKIANKIWDDVSILDDFLQAMPDMPKEQQDIVRGWKRRVKDKFMIERHLKKEQFSLALTMKSTKYLEP